MFTSTPFRIAAAFFLTLVLTGPAVLAAPKKKKAPVAATAPPATAATASLRIWKGDSGRAVHVILRRTGRGIEPTDLGELPATLRFGDYTDVPSGACTVELQDPTDPKSNLASLALQLAPGSFSTLLVSENAGALATELIDDTPRGGDTAELVVRNFASTLATLQIDAGPDVHVKLTSGHSFLHLRGLPRARLSVETGGTETAGTAVQWSNDVDFTKIRRATLLIHADPYGRIRPRVVIDGKASTGDSEPTATAPRASSP